MNERGEAQPAGVDPTQYYGIPSLVEVLPVAVQDPAEIDLWPIAVDQWRRMSIVTNEMTLLPLPLALASKMDEYALVIGAYMFPD